MQPQFNEENPHFFTTWRVFDKWKAENKKAA